MSLRLAIVRRSQVASTARIAPLARVRDSILGPGVLVGALSVIEDTTVGDHSYVGHNCTLKKVTVGKFCSFAWNVSVAGVGAHTTDRLTTHPFPYNPVHGFVETLDLERETKETVVGHDCWIGTNAVVLPGVRIGDGAVVGAGSVVSKSVPAYAIVTGIPATVRRFRFSPEIIEAVQSLEWWDWPDSELKHLARHFSEPADSALIGRLQRQRES